jgi:hypothetical protein
MNQPSLSEEPTTPRNWKAVYTVVERGPRKFWLRIGTAFVNKDQSLNVRLDASPTNGLLHIRESEPRELFDRREERAALGGAVSNVMGPLGASAIGGVR